MNYKIVSFDWDRPGLHAIYPYDTRAKVFVGRDEAMKWAWSQMEDGKCVYMYRTNENPTIVGE